MKITCSFCGHTSEKENGAVNRAKKEGKQLYCNKKCSGLGRRLNKSDAQVREEKRKYDISYREKNEAFIKARKAEAFKLSYDPVTASIKRKERAHMHLAYCQTGKYREWKSEYDKKRRAKLKYGEFWEAFLLLMNLEEEVYSRMDWYTIKLESGILNKSQRRKRHERANSAKLENCTLGNPE